MTIEDFLNSPITTTVLIIVLLWCISLYIFYLIIKTAVRNAIIEAKQTIENKKYNQVNDKKTKQTTIL